jgi:hypothetical protein
LDPWRVAATEAPTALLTPKLEAVEVAGVSNATTETMTQVTVKIEGAAGSLPMNNRDPRSALQQYSTSQPAVLPAIQVKQEPVEESGPLVSTPPVSPPDSPMEPGSSGPGIPMKSEPTTSFSTAAPSLSSGPQHGASGIAPQGYLNFIFDTSPLSVHLINTLWNLLALCFRVVIVVESLHPLSVLDSEVLKWFEICVGISDH